MCSLETNVARVEVCLSDKIANIPNKVCDSVLEHFSVNGAILISASQVTSLMADLQTSFLHEMRAEIRSLRSVNSSEDAHISNEDSRRRESDNFQFQMWTWGGRLHMVPADFSFPLCNVRTFWDLWWAGYIAKRIKPNRYLNEDLPGKKIKSGFFLAKSF